MPPYAEPPVAKCWHVSVSLCSTYHKLLGISRLSSGLPGRNFCAVHTCWGNPCHQSRTLGESRRYRHSWSTYWIANASLYIIVVTADDRKKKTKRVLHKQQSTDLDDNHRTRTDSVSKTQEREPSVNGTRDKIRWILQEAMTSSPFRNVISDDWRPESWIIPPYQAQNICVLGSRFETDWLWKHTPI